MKKILLSTIACATMMLAANSDYKYEITPMIGGALTEGNSGLDRNYMNGGLALGFNLQDSMIDQVELGFLRSTEDVDFTGGARDTGISRVFTNLVKEYDLNSAISLYALAGVGVEVFDDEANGNEDSPFGNYGAGIKYKIADQFALKADVRHLIETDHGDSTLLYNLGFAIPFGEVSKPAPVVVEPVVAPKPKPKPAPKDSDKDGVIDELDQCPNTMAGAKVDSVGCMTLVNLDINFDTNSAVIKNTYNPKIAEFASMLRENPKLSATIEAHTDSDGSNAYNQKLSEKRAASTVEALKALKVDPAKIKSVGYGETKPVASNATAEGKAENRRVNAVLNRK
ncbi:OmpA family protein [Arcobacter sp. s6]|jgi:OmpA-OmpF porin, OOP family|uniref:OmpA family protein n=1 Tax=Arcobacter sp. s6 TaxID=3230363 RepID=UPI0034A06A7A